MLGNIIKQAIGSDKNALVELFGKKKFSRSVNYDKEKYKNYLVDLTFRDTTVTLPKEIVPNDVTLSAFTFICKKDPLTLPILLRYFTHKNLLQEAKDDLDKLNQKLQGAMDKDLKDLQDKKTTLQTNKTDLDNKKIQGKEAKALAADIGKIDQQIIEASSKIKEIESCKEDAKNLLNGDETKSNFYRSKYFSILESKLTKVMEKKLIAYIEDNNDIERIYQINSKAKKIIVSEAVIKVAAYVGVAFQLSAGIVAVGGMLGGVAVGIEVARSSVLILLDAAIIMALAAFISYTTVYVASFVNWIYKNGFIKEMKDFIEGPKYIDKATNTEDIEKKLEQKKDNLINFSEELDPSGEFVSTQSNGSIGAIPYMNNQLVM